MNSHQNRKDFSKDFRIRGVAAWVAMVLLAGVIATPTLADTDAQRMVSMRVVENAAGGVDAEWMREGEPGQFLGWHVERQLADGGAVRVTDKRVDAGLLDSPTAIYRIHDAGAPARAGNSISYRLVAVDPELREWPTAFETYVVEAETAESKTAATKTPRLKSVPARRDLSPASVGARLRIVVTNDGLYRITAGQIAAALAGTTEAQIMQAIVQNTLALSCGGEAVAWRADASGRALYFFGQAYRDTYTDRNVYFLAPGPGLAMTFSDRGTTAVASDPWFWETVRAEQDLYFIPYLPGGVQDDYFMWTGQQITAPTASWRWTTPVALPDQHPSVPQGQVTAYLASSYNGTPALDNHTRLFADGQLLEDRLWAGNTRQIQTGLAANLSDGQVSVTLELQREANVTTMAVLVDALEVRYARRMRALNNQLLFRPEAGANTLTVRGFTTSAIQVFDVTDPLRPVALSATLAQETPGNWRASWRVSATSSNRFLAVASLLQPERIDGVRDGVWTGALAGAPHLVIAPKALAGAAAALVEYRKQRGLDSMLVPLEEIYDSFAFGRRDPRAIPRFLAHAKSSWTVPPAYVCLAGDGHLDYRDHFGQSQTRPNHVPPILDRLYQYNSTLGTTQIAVGVDNPLGDTDGNGVPDLAIGRLPAQTPAALARMIDRIKLHEASDAWKKKVLMVSDRDSANAFELSCGRLARKVPPGMAVQQMNHTPSTTTEAMRTNFIKSFNASVPISIYVGHANNTGLDSSYFFMHNATRSLMGTLTNQARTSLLLAGACMVNNFAQPYLDSRCIGKGFLDSAPGGAIAVWGTATENTLPMAEKAIGAILDGLFDTHDARLGDLINAALNAQAQSVMPWIVRANVLMGDPGTRIRTYLDEPASIQPTALALSSAGGVDQPIAVAADGPWTSVANASWITIAEGSSGSGSGTVLFHVEENTGPARSGSISISEDGITLTCQIDQAAATAAIALTSEPTLGGTLSGAGTYPVGQKVVLVATPNAGWAFAGWNDGGMQNPRMITVPFAGATYAAQFGPPPETAAIVVNRNPGTRGTVSGGGTFIVGSQQQISAFAFSGWSFAGWSDGNTDNPRTIAIPSGGATYTANFNVNNPESPVITLPSGGLAYTTTVSLAGSGYGQINDFDGDGFSDIAVFQPSSGNWNLRQSTLGQTNQPFGWSATVPVPADYDGDAVTDLAVYHPASGNWYIQESATGNVRVEMLGRSDAVPVPGDYDADGITDLAVYRRSAGKWSFLCSTAGKYEASWGWSSAVPVPADYDGDGATDIAVYHPASGNWYIFKSSDGRCLQKKWGWSRAVPVPADYDGDGMADIAVFHRATGKWYVSYSTGGSETFSYGWSAVTPVPADYDGDGITDIAVFHSASGNWYVRQSLDGRSVQRQLGSKSMRPTLLYPLIHSWFRLP
jgi:hypothetical protein